MIRIDSQTGTQPPPIVPPPGPFPQDPYPAPPGIPGSWWPWPIIPGRPIQPGDPVIWLPWTPPNWWDGRPPNPFLPREPPLALPPKPGTPTGIEGEYWWFNIIGTFLLWELATSTSSKEKYTQQLTINTKILGDTTNVGIFQRFATLYQNVKVYLVTPPSEPQNTLAVTLKNNLLNALISCYKLNENAGAILNSINTVPESTIQNVNSGYVNFLIVMNKEILRLAAIFRDTTRVMSKLKVDYSLSWNPDLVIEPINPATGTNNDNDLSNLYYQAGYVPGVNYADAFYHANLTTFTIEPTLASSQIVTGIGYNAIDIYRAILDWFITYSDSLSWQNVAATLKNKSVMSMTGTELAAMSVLLD